VTSGFKEMEISRISAQQQQEAASEEKTMAGRPRRNHTPACKDN
jgi:hypothetical protein